MRAADPIEAPLTARAPARGTNSVLSGTTSGTTSKADALKRLLARPSAPWLIIGLALVLSSPSLFTGLCADDYIHELMMREHPGIAGFAFRPFDLFSFADGDPVRAHQLIDEGVFPWWTNPGVVLAFFRPITSATHYADHLWWPNLPVLMHVQSLLWLALLLGVVGAIYRRFMRSAWIAGLALLLYSVDDARATTAAWLANRNALVALTLALPALLAYDKWRRASWRAGAFIGPLALAAGLFAGEAALTVVAYLVGYALFLDKGSPRARIWSLVPYAAVLLVWRAIYAHLGYGPVGSGIYFDPGRDPIGFLEAAAARLPVLLVGQFALPPADLWDLYPLIFPPGRWAIMLVAAVVIGCLGALVVPLWRRDPAIRFWTTGCLLSTLLMCTTFPHDRLLNGLGIGGMALAAEILANAIEGTFPYRRPWVTIAAASLAFVHLILAPLLSPYRARAMNDINRMFGRANESVPSDPSITTKSVVLVNPPLDPFGGYFLMYRVASGEPRPKHLRWLTTGVTDVRVERVDEQTLRIRPGAGFLSSTSQMMLRSLNHPMRLGERIALSGMTIEVSDLGPDGRPLEIVVRFAQKLEDPSLEWLKWGEHGYVPFQLPKVGESVVLPAANMREVLFG
jgi:hypothetical protein